MVFEKLQEWQRLYGVDDAALGKKIACSRQTVQRLKKGESMPRRSTLDKLREVTGGLIGPTECARFFEDLSDARRREQSPAPAEANA